MKELSVLKRIKTLDIDNIEEKMSFLSPKERKYFKVMKPQSGVLYVTARPGMGKSAIAKSIATKMGMQYMDIRLSMLDETDVGLFPNVDELKLKGGDILKVLDHVVPKWAHIANQKPTIIHFEELNRAPQAVRNAALQILLERGIGTEFEFNDNVLMLASGNLGEEDGTDVEEFDRALNNRLIHFKHDLEPAEWIKWFANDNVHPDIVSYIENHPHKMYVEPNENSTAHPSPRSWTFLSDYILNFYSTIEYKKNEKGAEVTTLKWGDSTEYIGDLEEIGMSYIGNEILSFLKYINNRIQININNIIDDFESVEENIRQWREKNRRDRYSEMLRDLRAVDLAKLNKKQVKNVINFINLCDADERISYLIDVVDDQKIDIDHVNYDRIFVAFEEDLEEMRDINKNERDKK